MLDWIRKHMLPWGGCGIAENKESKRKTGRKILLWIIKKKK